MYRRVKIKKGKMNMKCLGMESGQKSAYKVLQATEKVGEGLIFLSYVTICSHISNKKRLKNA